MFLPRRPGGRVVSKLKLVERFEIFERGQGHQFIRTSEDCDERSAVARRRRTRRVGNDVEVRTTLLSRVRLFVFGVSRILFAVFVVVA